MQKSENKKATTKIVQKGGSRLELYKENSDLNDFVHKMTEVVERTERDAEKVAFADTQGICCTMIHRIDLR